MSYDLLIEIGWKSVLTCGATLLLLRLLKHRSAAERSWIATAGVFVTVLLPLAALLGPRWRVETPEALPAILVQSAPSAAPMAGGASAPVIASTERIAAQANQDVSTLLPAEMLGWLVYLVPAVVLLLGTVAGVLRLYVLRRRSEILVEQDWLAALARAQRRMRFKHGTALLVSDDVTSPISWGFFRPTIVLNNEALNSRSQAEPIIAHELAHVARFDWVKLILGRAASAVFWFNPLVWLLVRESHQLCEEAADDAVLAAEVPCTDYATLLVEVASHESRGIMMAANGVAPGPASLKLRVARILNPQLSRNPARVSWATGCIAATCLAFTPLAAIAPVAPRLLVQPQGTAQARSAPNSMQIDASEHSGGTADAAQPSPANAAAKLVPSLAGEETPQGAAVAAAVATATPVAAAALAQIPAPIPPVWSGSAIPLPRFNAVELHGGGEVLVRHGSRQQVRIARGSLQPHQVSVDGRGRLFVRCGSGCTAETLLVEVVTPKVQALAIQGGGTVRASGSFPVQGSLALAIHGGGTLDARDLQASTVAAATHGGGTIMTQARNQLAASTTGGGEIRYWGDGNVVSAIQGGGKIEPGGGT